MIETSQTYKDLFASGAVQEYRITIDYEFYNEEDVYDKIELQQDLFDKDTFTVGSFTVDLLKVKLKVPSEEIPHNADFKLQYRYTDGDQLESEWVTKFKGSITKRTKHSDDVTSIEVSSVARNYDLAINVLITEEYPMNSRAATVQLANHLGLEVENTEDIINDNIIEYPNEKTVVEALREVAKNSGGNWVIVGDYLRLVTLQDVSVGEYTTQNIETLGEFAPISKVMMYYADGKAFESGDNDGSTLEIHSKWATQDSTDYVASTLNGYDYKPATASGVYIDPAVEVGDVIEIDGIEVLVANVRWTFDGATIADISVPSNNDINLDDPYNRLVGQEFAKKVSLGDSYQGVTISRDKGMEMLLSPDGTEENAIGKYYADLQRGMAFQYRDAPEDDWHDWMYFDTNENVFKLQLYSTKTELQDAIDEIELTPGPPGQDAVQWTIGTDGYWYADGVKTDKKAVGEDGSDADIWTIGANGNWFKNGVDTGQSSKGPKGDTGYTPIKGVDYFDGIDGQDGKGIVSSIVRYQNHTNGTTPPTGTWTENPSPIKGQYLWTRTVTTYTEGSPVPTYSVAYQAIDGTDGTDGKGIASTVVDYVKSTTAAMPSSGWSTTRPTVNKGEYLWTRTTINYTSGSPSVSISNSYVPTDGQNGTSAYLWVRYSQNANGNPMTTSPTNAKYIGVATTSTGTAPSEYNLYTWSLIKGQDGVRGETGQDGQTSYLHIKYSNDGGATFTSNNGENVGDWIGTYVDFIEADSPNVSSYTWNKVKGAKGDKGDKGDQGKGISSTVVTYQAGSSGTTTPTGNWSATVPTVSENQYLWTRTIITYTDNKTSTAYSVGKIGAQGPKGDTGTDGKGISSTTVTYQASTSGTVTPTGTWQTTVPTVAENQYLWTRIVINYTSGSPTTSYSIGKMGAQGPQGAKGDKGETGLRGATGEKGPKGDTGTSVSSVDEYYLATNLSSGVTTSTSGWKTTMQPMTTTNKYLWNYEVINFSDGSSSPTIPVIIGVHGSTGATGRALTSVTEYYLASASASGVTRPATDGTSGWTTTMQTTSTTKPYLWNYEKLTWSVAPTTSYIEPIIIGIHGATGPKGDKGDKGPQGPQGIRGPAGANGTSQYVHIRYSANANGNPLQTSPQTTTKYIGIANTTSSTAPTGYASYTWSKYVGDDGSQGPQGIQGPAGANGQPTYTWVKYADTPTSGMDDFPEGKKYIGLAFNKPTATESNNYSDYAWSLVKGENGIDGRSVDDIVTEFYLSTSKTSQSGGVWQVMMPTWQSGKYLWTRLKIDYINPVSTEYTTPEIDASWEAMDGLENEIIRVETQTTAKIEANTDAIDLEKTTRITQYGTLNDSIQENAGKINVLDNKVNIEVLEEIDGMRSKTSQIETELTNIEAKIEGISFGSIGINSTLEDDTYDFWESAVTNDPLEFNTGMMFRTGMDNYTIFEPFEDPSLLSPFGMSFFANGSQENGPFAVFNDYKYGYRIRRFSGNQPFTLEIKEYNGSKTYLRKQTYNFNTVQSYHDISNIEFGNDVEFIGLNYIVSGVSWTNRLQLAETMIGIGSPKPFVENVDGVKTWTQTQLQMQQAQIDLKVATKDFTGERMVSLISVQPASVKIASKNLDLQSVVKFTNLTDASTIISGDNIKTGKIKSQYLEFDNAVGTNVKLSGEINATKGTFSNVNISGNLNAGKVGNLTVTSTGITFPNGKLALNSSENAIQFGTLKMKYSTALSAVAGGNVDAMVMEGTSGGTPMTFYFDGNRSAIQVDTIVGSSQHGLDLGLANGTVHLPVWTYINGRSLYIDGSGYVRARTR